MPLKKTAQNVWGLKTVRRDVAWTAQTGIGFPDQPAHAHLEVSFAGYVQPRNDSDPDEGDECYVVADLAGSTVSPGKMVRNDRRNRGYFTHGMLVQMSFDPASPYLVSDDTPEGSAEGGSQSSSSSQSATFGFFGDTLTGSLTYGATLGGSRSFPDFEVTNLTLKGPQGRVSHQVMLALRGGGGGAYEKPASLVDDTNHGYLTDLTDRATGNFPLTSAGSFLALTEVKRRPPTSRLTVTVEHQLAIIVWNDDFFMIPADFGELTFDPHQEHLEVGRPMEMGEYKNAGATS